MAENQTWAEVNRLAAQWYGELLAANPHAADYLARRGLRPETIARFRIGYALDDWQWMTRRMTAARLGEAAVEAGLLGDKEGRIYDRFRNRIMFPITDPQGNIRGFGGRTLSADDPAKYYNTPESGQFSKRTLLYGLYETLTANPHPDRIVVTEGYMDTIRLHQEGLPAAVSVLGTALTPEHLDLLFAHTRHLLLCFDGDAAGIRAAYRAVSVCAEKISVENTVSVMFLPAGEDPDSLVMKEGIEQFMARMQHAEPILEWHARNRLPDRRSPEHLAKYAHEMIELARSLPDMTLRFSLIEQVVRIAGMGPAMAAAIKRHIRDEQKEAVPSHDGAQAQGGNTAPKSGGGQAKVTMGLLARLRMANADQMQDPSADAGSASEAAPSSERRQRLGATLYDWLGALFLNAHEDIRDALDHRLLREALPAHLCDIFMSCLDEDDPEEARTLLLTRLNQAGIADLDIERVRGLTIPPGREDRIEFAHDLFTRLKRRRLEEEMEALIRRTGHADASEIPDEEKNRLSSVVEELRDTPAVKPSRMKP